MCVHRQHNRLMEVTLAGSVATFSDLHPDTQTWRAAPCATCLIPCQGQMVGGSGGPLFGGRFLSVCRSGTQGTANSYNGMSSRASDQHSALTSCKTKHGATVPRRPKPGCTGASVQISQADIMLSCYQLAASCLVLHAYMTILTVHHHVHWMQRVPSCTCLQAVHICCLCDSP